MIPAPRTYVLRAPNATRGRLVEVVQHREGFIVGDANTCGFDADGSVGLQTTLGTLSEPIPYGDAIQCAEEMVARYISEGAELVEVKDYPPREFGPPRPRGGDIYLYQGVNISIPTFTIPSGTFGELRLPPPLRR